LTASTKLISCYAAGAILATSVNLITQWLSFHIYSGERELIVGIAAGTATGLISKYLFDKYFIFRDQSRKIVENLNKFILYCVTGGFTTTIFWSAEAATVWLSDWQAMRYIGAAIGLTIGYVTKFFLDRRFVFRVRQ
jgi:putative flippase GtrA